MIGSSVVSPIRTATHSETSTTRWNRRRRAAARTCPTATRRTATSCSRHDSAVSSAAPKIAANIPTRSEREPDLARGPATRAARPARGGRRRHAHADGTPARRRAMIAEREERRRAGTRGSTLARLTTRSARRPLLLDRARGEEEHLVRRHRRAEQRDREEGVDGPAFVRRHVAMRRAGAERRPSPGSSRHNANDDDDQRKTRSARRSVSIDENRTCHSTIHTTNPTSGIHSR